MDMEMKAIACFLAAAGLSACSVPSPTDEACLAAGVPCRAESVYLVDGQVGEILLWDLVAREPSARLRGTGSGVWSSPTSVAMGPDGYLYVTDFASNRVVRIDPRDEARDLGELFFNEASLEEPVDLLRHGGRFLTLGNDTGNITFISDSGDLKGELGRGWLRSPHDFEMTESGVLAVADQFDPTGDSWVSLWDLDSHDAPTGVLRPPHGPAHALAVVETVDGAIIVADWESSILVRYEEGEEEGVVLATEDEGLEQPVSLLAERDGSLLVATSFGLQRWDSLTGAHLEDVVSKEELGLDSIRRVQLGPRN
jgi:hypothetical protein